MFLEVTLSWKCRSICQLGPKLTVLPGITLTLLWYDSVQDFHAGAFWTAVMSYGWWKHQGKEKKKITTNSCHTVKINKQKTLLSCPFGPLTPGWRREASRSYLVPLDTPCSLLLVEHWALCSSVQAVAIWKFSDHLIPLQFWVFQGWSACRDYSGKGRALSVQSQRQGLVFACWFQEVFLNCSCAKSCLCCPGAGRGLESDQAWAAVPN